MPRLVRIVFTALVALVASATAAHAQLVVDINRGHLDPTPVAVPDFLGETDQERRLGADIAAVIANNLARSALFDPIDPSAYIEQITSVNTPPRFPDWRLIDAEALLVGSVDITDEGAINVDFRLWDVLAQQQLAGLRYTTSTDSWRRVAHKVSDAIYERLTGEQGYFDTRVVFIDESGPKTNRIKRLAIMDQDGANPSFLTNGLRNVNSATRYTPTASTRPSHCRAVTRSPSKLPTRAATSTGWMPTIRAETPASTPSEMAVKTPPR